MIIGMRGHDFGRMEPAVLAQKIASYGYRAAQLAFGKAFPQSPEAYMTEQALMDKWLEEKLLNKLIEFKNKVYITVQFK